MSNRRGLNLPNPRQTLAGSQVLMANSAEVIFQPLYDTQVYPNAGANALAFFQESIGVNNKTVVQTNMELNGQLPKGQAFVVTAIQVAFYSGELSDGTDVTRLVDDARTFAENGALVFRIGSKDYVTQAPLGKFPPVEGLEVVAAVADGTGIINVEYARTDGREFAILDLELASSNNFKVSLLELPALPSGIDGKIVVSLNGYLYRNTQ